MNPLAKLVVRRFAIMPYEPVWLAMQNFTRCRDINSADEVWLLQHEPVFTLGQAGRLEHVLSPGDIPMVQSDRGGQVTYHGPGQLVAYILVDLRRLNLGTRDLVSLIEQSIINSLAVFNVKAMARADAPGVYIGDAKIASLGLRVRRGASYHGLALNVDMDLEPFRRINPCGYEGLKMVQLRDFAASASLADIASVWLNEFTGRLGYMQLINRRGLPRHE